LGSVAWGRVESPRKYVALLLDVGNRDSVLRSEIVRLPVGVRRELPVRGNAVREDSAARPMPRVGVTLREGCAARVFARADGAVRARREGSAVARRMVGTPLVVREGAR
jgi:hypothetical protein